MKVTLVSSGSGSRGGGEIYLALLAEQLAGLGHEICALIPDHARMNELAERLARTAVVERFPYVSTYDRRLRHIGATLDRRQRRSLRDLFRRTSADIVHVNQQVAEDGLDLVLAASASGLPWVSTIHVGRGAGELSARLGNLRDRWTRSTITATGGDYIAVCSSARDQLAARLGSAPRLHVVHNGAPVPDAADLAAARKAARAEWGASNEDVVVGSLGRIEAQKAPLMFVDHVAKAAGGDSRIRMVWIGDGSMRDDLRARAALYPGVAPLTIDGWRANAALRVAGFDIFVLPSAFEGLPFALLETMHTGVPIVASDVDGIAEAISSGETGYLCSNTDEWNDALMRLVTDRELRQRIGAAARQVAQTHFSAAAMAKGTLDVYASVLARLTKRH